MSGVDKSHEAQVLADVSKKVRACLRAERSAVASEHDDIVAETIALLIPKLRAGKVRDPAAYAKTTARRLAADAKKKASSSESYDEGDEGYGPPAVRARAERYIALSSLQRAVLVAAIRELNESLPCKFDDRDARWVGRFDPTKKSRLVRLPEEPKNRRAHRAAPVVGGEIPRMRSTFVASDAVVWGQFARRVLTPREVALLGLVAGFWPERLDGSRVAEGVTVAEVIEIEAANMRQTIRHRAQMIATLPPVAKKILGLA